MRIEASRRLGIIAAGVVAITIASGRTLPAQGGHKVAPLVGPAVTAPEGARLEPARGILHTLVGTWRFEVWFAGNFGGTPDAAGTRVVAPLFDDLRLQWTEQLDRSQVRGQGIIGFDPGSGRFFGSAVYSAGSAPDFLIGVLDGAEPLVTFNPVAISPEVSPAELATRSFSLTMLDGDHFRLAALDHGWRAVFTRQP